MVRGTQNGREVVLFKRVVLLGVVMPEIDVRTTPSPIELKHLLP